MGRPQGVGRWSLLSHRLCCALTPRRVPTGLRTQEPWPWPPLHLFLQRLTCPTIRSKASFSRTSQNTTVLRQRHAWWLLGPGKGGAADRPGCDPVNHWREMASRGQFSGHTSWAQTALPNAMSSHVQSSLLLLLHPAVATVGQASLDSPLQSREAAGPPELSRGPAKSHAGPLGAACLTTVLTQPLPKPGLGPSLEGMGVHRRARAKLPSSLPPSPPPGLLGPHRRI